LALRLKSLRGGVTAPRGFLAGAASAGIKPGAERDDLALVVSERPAVSAGVFTTNQMKAAPVLWSSAIVRRGGPVRAVLLNSGNANACTGRRGEVAVERSARAAARALALRSPSEVLVASTGVIGVPLPVGRLVEAMPRLATRLGSGRDAAAAAARAIMTTDTRPKQRALEVRAGGRSFRVGGMAKGAGMIHPEMATMLCVVTTDAPLGRAQARRLLARAAERSFNSITVDGDTSTNDCVLLMAGGAAGGRVAPGSRAERAVGEALDRVCLDLAETVAADAEGARKLIQVNVRGASSEGDARRVARAIASSMLVKTAIHGGDPNWGRILAAAGRSGVRLDASALALRIGGHLVARAGGPRPAGEGPAARHLRGRRIRIDLTIGRGRADARALGCDLSADYVAINASYRS
jgi:glutamate N-acetyltransferase/amino-acid N-acetyltransferase